MQQQAYQQPSFASLIEKSESALNLDILAVAAAYGGETGEDTILCPSPEHADTSLGSVRVFVGDDGKQRFKCHACGVFGDVLDLILYLDSEVATNGQARARAAELAEEGLEPAPAKRFDPKAVERAKPRAVRELADAEKLMADSEQAVARLRRFLASRQARYDVEWLMAEWRIAVDRDGSILIPYFREADGLADVLKHRWVNAATGDGEPTQWGKPMGPLGVSFRSWLYGEWRDKRRQRVVLCEGESDTWAVSYELREDDADVFGIPHGAAAVCDSFALHRLRGRDVVLLLDGDNAGGIGAVKWAKALDGVAASVRVATLPSGHDASEAGPETVIRAVGEATEVEGCEDDAPGSTQGGLRLIRGSDVKRTRVRYLWADRVPLGELTVMPGEEGIGKSTVLARMAADVTRGTLQGECWGRPRSVLVIAPEDAVDSVVVPRLEQAGADMERVFLVNDLSGPDGDRPVELPTDLAALKAAVTDHDIGLVWIDALAVTLPSGVKTISYKDTNEVLRPISRFAQEHQVAVIAPWHLNKSSAADSALRMMDSRGFRTVSRSVLFVVRPKDGADNEGLVIPDKANATAAGVPALRYRLRSARYSVTERDDQTGEERQVTASCGVADWVSEEEGGRQRLREELGEVIARSDDGARWLTDYLSVRDGKRALKSEILIAWEAADMGGVKKLERAAKKAGVASVRSHAPGGAAIYCLPTEDKDE